MNNDDQHGGGNGGDWFDNHAPPAPAPGGGAFDDNAVREAYKKYLGREPNAQELAAHRGNPGGSGAVVTLIQNSPEAKDYLARSGAGAGGGEGPQNGNFQAWFSSLTNGKAPTPDMLRSLEPILNKYGVTLAPNAAGVAGKIKLPGGMIIDVIQGADGGGKAWQWLTPSQAGGGTGAAPNPQMAPAPGPYTSAPWTGGEYAPPPLPTELQTPFTAPTQAELEASPGYATRLAAGRQTLERSAAARGTISNGGTMKALERYAQDYGSNEYQNLYGQKMGARNQNYAEYQGAVNVGNQTYQNRYGAWQTENNRTRDDYTLNTGTRRNWEQDYWGRLRDVYRGGLDAAL